MKAARGSGYFEWRTTSSGKVPFWFHLKSEEPFFLAGLWDSWHETKPDAVTSYILMTTEPNEIAAKVHDRMPVLLHARDVPRWLDAAVTDSDEIIGLLRPYPAEDMEARPVSRRVSDPQSEGPGVIRPDHSRYVTSFYRCGGCQVMFYNPRTFSSNGDKQRPRPIT